MPRALEPRPHLASLVQDFLKHGDETAVVYRDALRQFRASYRDVAGMAGRFAAELERRHIGKGERVLIWGQNGAPWISAFYGCLLRGVLAVPIDVAGTPEFARRVAAEVGAKLCAGSRDHLALLGPEWPVVAFEDFEADLPGEPDFAVVEGLTERDPFQIVFTSGTTGEPKGVVHTHRNVLASLRPIEQEMQKYLKYERIFHPLRFLHTLPLSHVFGQFMGLWIPALLAAEVHFENRLVPGGLVDEIKDTRISVVAAVPRVLDILRSHVMARFPGIEQRIEAAQGASPLKRWWLFRDVHRMFGLKFWAFVCGGATLPGDVERFWNSLGLAVIQGYGMTETAALVSLNHPFHQARGSIGKVLPGREIRLGDDGEILVRGETVSTATWEKGGLRERPSEWLETGDLAAVDEGGNLRYRGRKKEVIVTASGLNVYPEDLEAALQRQPGVKACAVVEAEGRGGPEPIAALVMRAGADPSTAVKEANRGLAEYQQIRRWILWPEPDLPRTSTGKVLRREVAKLAAAPASQMALSGANTLAGILHQITGEDVTNRGDETLLSEDLHLDSLGRVELQSNLEMQFGLQIDDDTWQHVRTLGDLRTLLRDTGDVKGPAASSSTAAQEAPEGHIYPTWPWVRVQRWIRSAFLETGMRFFVWFLANPKVQSELQPTPAERVLIVSNHVTAYDVPLILYGLPGEMRRRVAVAMGAELLRDLRKGRNQGSWFVDLVAPIGYFLITALFNVFPLPQRTGFRESFQHAGRAMDAGFDVIVFPEGRRTQDGRMHEFQAGAGLLWSELRTAALPVYLEGLAALKAEGSGWFRSGRLTVRVGQPISLPADIDAAEATRVLEQAVRRLSEEE